MSLPYIQQYLQLFLLFLEQFFQTLQNEPIQEGKSSEVIM